MVDNMDEKGVVILSECLSLDLNVGSCIFGATWFDSEYWSKLTAVV